MQTSYSLRKKYPYQATTKVSITPILKFVLENKHEDCNKNGFRATELYNVDYSKCKNHIINNVSNDTACNKTSNATFQNLSIENF